MRDVTHLGRLLSKAEKRSLTGGVDGGPGGLVCEYPAVKYVCFGDDPCRLGSYGNKYVCAVSAPDAENYMVVFELSCAGATALCMEAFA